MGRMVEPSARSPPPAVCLSDYRSQAKRKEMKVSPPFPAAVSILASSVCRVTLDEVGELALAASLSLFHQAEEQFGPG